MDDEIGLESCAWLEANKSDYSYLCTFKDVASTCPGTCGFCPVAGWSSGTEPRTLSTAMNGTVEWYGNMFNVAATSDVIVTSLSFHTASTEPVDVAVYTKQGTYADGSEQLPETWTLIAETTVQGKGVGNRTTVPASDFDAVELSEGDLQAFYLTTGDVKNVILSGGSGVTLQLHDMWTENGDLTILTGEAVTGKFGGSYSPYAWNGRIHYSAKLDCVDKSGTIYVENVGDKSCAWLSKNQARFGFLCDRITVATTCPVTCSFCKTPTN